MKKKIPAQAVSEKKNSCKLKIPHLPPITFLMVRPLGREVPTLLLMPDCLTDCLKDRAVGNQTRQKTATLRIMFGH